MLLVLLLLLITNTLTIHSTQQQEEEEESTCKIADVSTTTVCTNINFDNDKNLIKTTIIEETNRLIIEDSFSEELNAENFQFHSNFSELILKMNNFIKIKSNTLCGADGGGSSLQQLQIISNRQFPKLTKQLFTNCNKLKQLYLDNVIINDKELFVEELQHLEILNINNTQFEKYPTFNRLNSLKSLTLHYTNIKDYLNQPQATPPPPPPIFKQLINLDLQHNELDSLLPIIDLLLLTNQTDKLKILDLSFNNFNNTIWQYLNNFKSLNVLFLDHNNHIDDVIDIRQLLKNCPQLERMFLSRHQFLPEKIQQIDEELKMIIIDGDGISNKNFNLIWIDNN